MGFEQIRVERDGPVGIVTLNRPDRMNAWTYQMNDELITAIDELNRDADVGAIVLTGAGRGFCAGADISDNFKARIDGEVVGPRRRERWVRFVRESKPIVVALNGVAVGLGVTLTLPCDVLMASEKARMGMFFVKMGVTPELASSHFLVQRVGFGRASEMCLSAKLYDAAELKELGLVDHVVPADELLSRACELARTIAANPAPQLRMVKELLTANGTCDDLDVVERREAEVLGRAYKTPEHREAVQAFLDKREPDFKGAAARGS